MARLRELGGAPELQSHPHKSLITVSHHAALSAQVLESIVGLHDLLQRLRRVGRHSRAFFFAPTRKGLFEFGGGCRDIVRRTSARD